MPIACWGLNTGSGPGCAGCPHLPASPQLLDGDGSSVQLAKPLRPLLKQQLQDPALVMSAAFLLSRSSSCTASWACTHACCRLAHSNAAEGVWPACRPRPPTANSSRGHCAAKGAGGHIGLHSSLCWLMSIGDGAPLRVCTFRAGRWPGVQQKVHAAAGMTQSH